MVRELADLQEVNTGELCTGWAKDGKKAVFAGRKMAKRGGQKIDKPIENSYHAEKAEL